jgi:hypothetical protein
MARVEAEAAAFFALLQREKEKAVAAMAASGSPFGYNSKPIGGNGDLGSVEYLLPVVTAVSPLLRQWSCPRVRRPPVSGEFPNQTLHRRRGCVELCYWGQACSSVTNARAGKESNDFRRFTARFTGGRQRYWGSGSAWRKKIEVEPIFLHEFEDGTTTTIHGQGSRKRASLPAHGGAAC